MVPGMNMAVPGEYGALDPSQYAAAAAAPQQQQQQAASYDYDEKSQGKSIEL
jgi:hypothetical protein